MLDFAPCRKVSSRLGSCCRSVVYPSFPYCRSISWVVGISVLDWYASSHFSNCRMSLSFPSSRRNPQSDRCKSHILHTPHTTHTHEGFAGENQMNSFQTHILWVFEEAPPAIFWTRSWLSSVFNSSSCLVRSSLLFPQS